MPSADDDAANVAARRRGAKAAPRTTVSPGAAPAPVERASAATGQTVAAAAPDSIVVSRTVLAEHVLATDGVVAFGDPGARYTAILSPGSATPLRGDYVQATCDVYEAMIPLRATSPVERLLWRRGWLIRRDVHESVLAAHAVAVAEGTAGTARPAALDPTLAQQAPPLDPSVRPEAALADSQVATS